MALRTRTKRYTIRRKRPSIKKALLLIILIGVVPYSYFNSSRIYAFYMKVYYERILGQSVEQLVRAGEKMYHSKEYSELSAYLDTLVRIYPENMALRRLEGLTQIKLGQGRIGTDTLLSSAVGKRLPEETLMEASSSLYELKDYRDIVMILKRNEPGNNKNLLRYYGISLVKVGQNRPSLPVLQRAIAQGAADHATYLHIGIAHNNLGDPRAAIPYLERSRGLDDNDPVTADQLAQAYVKLGRYKDAERILRRITR